MTWDVKQSCSEFAKAVELEFRPWVYSRGLGALGVISPGTAEVVGCSTL
jgi:hypothetical protein